MRALRNVMTTTGLLVLALLPMVAAVSRTEAPSASARAPAAASAAIAQPVAVPDRLHRAVPPGGVDALMESGLLVLVGSALIGLAAAVRNHG